MNYLVYCLFDECPHLSSLGSIQGIGGTSIFLVENDGLIAAVSRIYHLDLTPSLSRILQYQKIIEWFHHSCTVIPMRYGCALKKESEVTGILKKHGEEYKKLLKELEGCEEMGIRILRSEFGPPRRDSTGMVAYCCNDLEGKADEIRPSNTGLGGMHPYNFDDLGKGVRGAEGQKFELKSEIGNKQSSHPGHAYLAVRKALYNQEDGINKENESLIEDYHKVFAGLFVKCKKENPPIHHTQAAIYNGLLFSLYFLVPRNLINSFRQVFQGLPAKEDRKILLSGPWPPFNFVHSTQGGTFS